MLAVAFALALPVAGGVTRKAKPLPDGPVDAAESAALFVGVREFTHDRTLAEVRYAADDAIDLAYLLAIERVPRLVDPRRVVLALSGKPRKPESETRLIALLDAAMRARARCRTGPSPPGC